MINTEERNRGNRLLAEFININFSMGSIRDYKNTEKLNPHIKKQIRFHSNWNLLNRVISVLEWTGYALHTDPHSIELVEYVTGDGDLMCTYDMDSEYSRIENYWYALVEFVTKLKELKLIENGI